MGSDPKPKPQPGPDTSRPTSTNDPGQLHTEPVTKGQDPGAIRTERIAMGEGGRKVIRIETKISKK